VKRLEVEHVVDSADSAKTNPVSDLLRPSHVKIKYENKGIGETGTVNRPS